MVMHEVKPGWTITREWEGYTIEADQAFSEVDETQHLGIMFSGGRAPEYIRYDEDLVRITKYFFRTRQTRRLRLPRRPRSPPTPTASEAAAWPTVPKCKFDLEVCGGTFVDEPCVIDRNLVSGRTFHDNGHYLGPWIKLLEAARDNS